MRYMIYALLVSAAVTILLGPVLIPLLKRLKFGQTERELGPKSHLTKQGTPTIGGLMFIFGILAGTLSFSLSATEMVLPALLCTVGFALVGFLDDFLKVRVKNTVGLRPYQKIIAQFLIAGILAVYAYKSPFIGSKLYVPFTGAEWDLGLFYVPFVMFVIIGTVNSVNLTDGLDGLASGVTLIYSLAMGIAFLYLSSALLLPADAGQAQQTQFAAELNSMAVFACAVAGGCLGFLRFNTYPAQVFMGDTGSLGLGGAVAVMAVFSRCVLLLPIMGACFVASTVSVILQVGSYKLRKKRIFKMAPLHHHFELQGHSETRIVAVYMILTTALCLLCLLAFQ
ncbi:MAG: phospho-N-acetylmuramoyl-pentapeptide-transferase [Christensenellaceae bacterium]|jgi:phospho-N-acetylmuramoyl-pentapeptide-transferase|nr:phospho-N-acetylmuramoyl-pentapeptide-transferase [Christensenellaceae bacterium]